jgi:hypothetical protein
MTNLVCYNSLLMEKYRLSFEVALPYAARADEMAALVRGVTGVARVEIIPLGPQEVTVQPAIAELQPGEEYPHQKLAQEINGAFGIYLRNSTRLMSIGAVGGYVDGKGEPRRSDWTKQARWLDVLAHATEADKAYITSVLEAGYWASPVRLYRKHSAEWLVENRGLDINTAKFLVDALKSEDAQR